MSWDDETTTRDHVEVPTIDSPPKGGHLTLRQRLWLLQDEIDDLRYQLDTVNRCLVDIHEAIEREE
jgi:hypothetical protein